MLHHASFGVSNIEKSYTFYDAFFRAGAGSSAGAGHHLAFRSKSRSSQTISSGCLGARGIDNQSAPLAADPGTRMYGKRQRRSAENDPGRQF